MPAPQIPSEPAQQSSQAQPQRFTSKDLFASVRASQTPAAPAQPPAQPQAQPAAQPAQPVQPVVDPAGDVLLDIPQPVTPAAAAPVAPNGDTPPVSPQAPQEPVLDENELHGRPGIKQAFENQKSYWLKQVQAKDQRIAELEAKAKQVPQSQQPDSAMLAELEAARQLKQSYETLKQRAETAERSLAQVSVEHDPQFQAAFVVPEREKLSEAKQALAAYGIDENQAEAIAALSGKDRVLKIRDLTKDLGDIASMAAAEISLPFRAVDGIRAKRSEAMKDARSLGEQMETNRKAQAAELRNRVKAQALGIIAAEGDVFFRVLPQNYNTDPVTLQKWNSQASALHQKLDAVLSSNDVLTQTKLIADGIRVPLLQQINAQKDKKIAELKAALTRLQGAAPGSGNPPPQEGSAPPANQGQVPANEKMTPASLVKSIIASRSQPAA